MERLSHPRLLHQRRTIKNNNKKRSYRRHRQLQLRGHRKTGVGVRGWLAWSPGAAGDTKANVGVNDKKYIGAGSGGGGLLGAGFAASMARVSGIGAGTTGLGLSIKVQ